MNWYDYLLLFALPIAGGAIAILIKGIREDQLRMLLSFSGAYLFGITILHMMPHVYESHSLQPGIYILAGFILQIILDHFSRGAEHGHVHHRESPGTAFLLSVMIGLGIHAFLEGIPLSGYHDHGVHDHRHMDHYPLLFGIAVHKLPEAFALTSILIAAKLRIGTIFTLLLLFSCITPLATFLSELLVTSNLENIESLMPVVTAFVIGSFLHISTTILFEVDSKIHKFNVLKMIAILTGLVMAMLTVL